MMMMVMHTAGCTLGEKAPVPGYVSPSIVLAVHLLQGGWMDVELLEKPCKEPT